MAGANIPDLRKKPRNGKFVCRLNPLSVSKREMCE